MKTITSLHNQTVQHLVGLAKNRDYRKEFESLLLEGKNAIVDVSKSLKPKRIVITEGFELPEQLKICEVLQVTPAIMQKISSVKSPEGIIAEFPFPKMLSLDKKRKIVALDRVRDPGNLGTLLRTALALGWDGVFLLPECADPFNEKALRASKGATFFLPIQQGSWDNLSELSKNNHLPIFVADSKGVNIQIQQKNPACILLLGNEADGVKIPDTITHTTISIPMGEEMNSLNVAAAGAILMYALQDGK